MLTMVLRHRLKRHYRYQFCFRAILEAVDKALVKAVRAVGSKKDEIAGLQFDIADLEGDIGHALDNYAGEALGDELLAIGGRVSGGVKADVRWSAFDASRDKASASNVPPAVRRKSLEAAENQWHLRGNVPVGADAQGYASRSVTTLGQRVEALAISAGPDAWRKRYAEVCGLGGDFFLFGGGWLTLVINVIMGISYCHCFRPSSKGRCVFAYVRTNSSFCSYHYRSPIRRFSQSNADPTPGRCSVGR